MKTNTKQTPLKIALRSGGNTGREFIVLAANEEELLGEFYRDTSHDEKTAIVEACNNYEQVKAQRDALLAACKGLLQEFVPSRDAFGSTPQGRAYDAARKALALCEKGGAQ